MRKHTKSCLSAATSVAAIGLDVGDQYSQVSLLDGQGNKLAEDRIRSTPAGLQRVFAHLPRVRVALETSAHSGWMSRLLTALGHEVIVAQARKLAAIHRNDRKNDRADAEILARLVRVDPSLLHPIRHRSAELQADLNILRSRDALIRARTQLINHARGIVKSHAGHLPRCSTRAFPYRVAQAIPLALRPALGPVLGAVDVINTQLRGVEHELAVLASQRYPQTALLQQVTGVGLITALTFILTLADPHRFHASRDVGPYLGLVPRQEDSGQSSPQLGITHAGNTALRCLLVNCAHYILGRFGPDSDLRQYGLRIMQRGGKNAKKRALVAVARKLAVLLHHLWVTGEVYNPTHSSPSSAA